MGREIGGSVRHARVCMDETREWCVETDEFTAHCTSQGQAIEIANMLDTHGDQRYRDGLLRAIPVLQRWVDTHEAKYGGRDDMGRKALLRTCMDEIRALAGGVGK